MIDVDKLLHRNPKRVLRVLSSLNLGVSVKISTVEIRLTAIYMSGFMKTAFKNLTPISSVISRWFHHSMRPPPSHVKWQKIEKGRQWIREINERRKEKKDWLSFSFYIDSTPFTKIQAYIDLSLLMLLSFDCLLVCS